MCCKSLKLSLIIWVLIVLFSCSSQKKNDKKTFEENQLLEESQDKLSVSTQEELSVSTDEFEDDLMPTDEFEWDLSPTNHYTTDENNYIISTYDISEIDKNIEPIRKRNKELLRQLSDYKVFSSIQKIRFKNLVQKHKEYFNSKPDFELIFYTKGNLFQNNKADYAFIIYDKENSRITILVYDEYVNKYFELYRDIKVEGELNCYYYNYGTLDYILGEELVRGRTTIDTTKAPESYITDEIFCKITNILNDKNILLKRGCFADDVSKENPLNALCIATSFTYNNWECLLYDKSKNVFKFIYGQAFAD